MLLRPLDSDEMLSALRDFINTFFITKLLINYDTYTAEPITDNEIIYDLFHQNNLNWNTTENMKLLMAAIKSLE